MRNAIPRSSILLFLLLLWACDRGAETRVSTPEDGLPVTVSDPAPSKAEESVKLNETALSSNENEAPTTTDAHDKMYEAIKDAEDSPPDAAEDNHSNVRQIPFDAQEFPSELPNGHVDGGLAFIDRAGVNYVVFTLDAPMSREHIRKTTLHIKHVVQNEDTIREVRSYIERIDDCDFDVIVKPYYGDWSISDVNNNGIGEVSFAYTADCVADISPFAHKAFITEAGEKYALRGFTVRQYPDGFSEGGSYKADKMPPLFRKKVKKVWNRTSQH